MNWSLLYTWFRSLHIAHLEQSLYTLSRQTIKPDEVIFYDNGTAYSEAEIRAVIAQHFPDLIFYNNGTVNEHAYDRTSGTTWRFVFDKHNDPKKTASYCHNRLIPMSSNDMFILARADLLYDFDFCRRVLEIQGGDPMVFATAWMFQMPLYSKASYETADYAHDLDPLNWREDPQRLLQNKDGAQMHSSAELDSASFCMSKTAFNLAGGYDEHLDSWGYWEMSFQTELRRKGVQFKVIPEPLIYHMLHALMEGEGERDQARAHAQWKQSPRRKNSKFQPL